MAAYHKLYRKWLQDIAARFPKLAESKRKQLAGYFAAREQSGELLAPLLKK